MLPVSFHIKRFSVERTRTAVLLSRLSFGIKLIRRHSAWSCNHFAPDRRLRWLLDFPEACNKVAVITTHFKEVAQ